MKRILTFCFALFSAVHAFAQVWDSLGGGLTGIGSGAKCLSVYNNKLYVSGTFTIAGKVPVSKIARWDGSQWDSVGQGIQGSQNNCGFCIYNNKLYLGGFFNGWGVAGVPYTDYLAKWNDTVWSAVSVANPNAYVNAIAYRNELYIGGGFLQVGSATYRSISKLIGTNWSDVAGGLWGGFSSINTFCQYNGKLIVGGGFTLAGGPGGIPCWYIASWDGTKWDTLNGGFDSRVFALAVDTANNFLYAGGPVFAENKGMYVQVNSVARWDGFQWSPVGNNTGNTYILKNGVLSLEMYHGELFAGGPGFDTTATDTIIARWDGSDWRFVADGYSTIYALKEWKDTLYVGGSFDTIGGIRANKIASYYAPPDTTCRFLQSLMYAYPPGNPKLYADTFKYAGDSVAIEFYNNIGSASSWQWNFGDSTTSSGKTPVHYYTAGTYTVSVVVNYPYGPKGPCIDTVYRTITVINTTSISPLKSQISYLAFKVYPNPTTGEITIELNAELKMQNAALKIYDVTGKLIKIIEKLQPANRQIKISNLTKGSYLIELSDNGSQQRYTQKVAVE